MKKTKWWRSKYVFFFFLFHLSRSNLIDYEHFRGAACTSTASAVKHDRFALSMYNVAGLFITLGVGIFLAVIVVIFELMYRCHHISKKEGKPFLDELFYELRFALNMNSVSFRRNHFLLCLFLTSESMITALRSSVSSENVNVHEQWKWETKSFEWKRKLEEDDFVNKSKNDLINPVSNKTI